MFVKPGTIDPDRHPVLHANREALAEDKRGPEHLTVRDPVTKRSLPKTGAEVPETPYWHRRLRDGDVVAAQAPTVLEPWSPPRPPKAAPAAPAKAPPSKPQTAKPAAGA